MQSESIANLAKALAAAQAEIVPPKKTKVGKIRGQTKAGKDYEYEYYYASLSDLMESRRLPLAKNGIAITHTTRVENGHMVMVTTLMHESGEWKDSEYPIPIFSKPQEQGSAITYATRYSEQLILALAGEDDDDGAAAQNADPRPVAVSTKSQPPEPHPAGIKAADVEAVHIAAKRAGIKTVNELGKVLNEIVGVTRANQIPPGELQNVFDALNSMAESRS